jgi:hypothetical protein
MASLDSRASQPPPRDPSRRESLRARVVRIQRAAAIVALALATLALASAIAACIIADPPPDLPKAPPHHPNIVHSAVVPPATKVIATFPSKFIVPVEVLDPNTPFVFHVFVDYDPLGSRDSFVQTGDKNPDPSTLDGGVSIIDFSIDAPDPSSCHVIEIIVALGFNNASPHTPNQYGGDSLVWFYNPSGDPGACPQYDAGSIDGAAPDVQPDRIFVPPTDGGGA